MLEHTLFFDVIRYLYAFGFLSNVQRKIEFLCAQRIVIWLMVFFLVSSQFRLI